LADNTLAISKFGSRRHFQHWLNQGSHSASALSTVEYGMAMDTAESYDALANHYHLMFENWEASVERQAAALSSILQRQCGLASTARILDCACGIGTQALGLAKVGFRVCGCDVSPEAVKRAQLEASGRGLDIQFFGANMLDLSCLGDSHFDAVICMDNALPHLESAEQLVQAAQQIRARLHPGGSLMASIRDYDRLIQERPVVQGPSFYSDQGQRRIVFQVWDWVDDRRYIFHLYITRQFAKGWQTFHISALYRAIRRDEVLAALSKARFRNVRWLFQSDSGFYQPIVLAEAD
jgi:glycine/sarcosine N-methyltransferase